MFNRYWRTYPLLLQMLLFVLLFFTLASFSQLILYAILPKISRYTLTDLTQITTKTTPDAMRMATYIRAIVNLLTLGGTGLLFANFTTPRPFDYLGLRRPGRPVHWLLAAGIMLGLIPFMSFLQEFLQQHIHIWKGGAEEQQQTEAMRLAFIHGQSFVPFIVLGLVPAFCEELLFRGLLQKFAFKFMKRMWFSIFFAAVIFTLMHGTPYGYPSIFLCGTALGVIYWYTRSIWCSMLGHFIFNAVQIAGALFLKEGAWENNGILIGSIVAGSLIIAIACGFALYKTRTSLPAGWANDYTPEERDQQDTPFSKPF